VAEPQPFHGDHDPRLVRSRYYQEMHQAIHEYPLKPTPRLEGGELVTTAFELIEYLGRQKCKIYCTGHSLGGGLTTLLGAYMTQQMNLVSPTAIVSFAHLQMQGMRPF